MHDIGLDSLLAACNAKWHAYEGPKLQVEDGLAISEFAYVDEHFNVPF